VKPFKFQMERTDWLVVRNGMATWRGVAVMVCGNCRTRIGALSIRNGLPRMCFSCKVQFRDCVRFEER